MTVQDITMGYDAMTGERITLTEHEQMFIEFCEYRGIDPHAWKKTDQIGYYRALQEDWETARDDELTPLVVDKFSDLSDDVREAVDFREREARGIRGRFGWDVWAQWLDLPAKNSIDFIERCGVPPARAGLVAARIEAILADE